MRISRIQLAGLAVAIAGGAAHEAAADDLTISTATTTPVATANPLNGTPGDITISNTGSVTVTAGQTAVTLNSANRDVTNNGTIASNNADDVLAIYALGGFSGDISNGGAINLLEDHTVTDTDGDGDGDGTVAIGDNRHAIFVDGAFTGNITNLASGTITVEGNNSSGITVDGTLTGDVINSGAVTVIGGDSYGIHILGGGVTGDVISTGNIVARGENSSAVRVDGQIGGALSLNGAYVVSGYLSNLTPPADQSGFEPEDILMSGAFVDVRASIGGGITIAGVGVEDDLDDDGDGITETTGDADDDNTAQVLMYGSAPAILVRADAGNVVLGATASGYGLHNRGSITVNGVYDGRSATGFRVEGSGGNTVDTAGGIATDNLLSVASREADAFGISIGDGALVPEILNRNRLFVATTSENVHTAYGVYLEGGATNAVTNTGIVAVELYGEAGSAFAIYDASNTLATITNSGTLVAQVVATDDDLSDNVVPTVTGDSVAIDVSASTIDVLIEQIATIPFTDDDLFDDDVTTPVTVQILGDIRLGAGNDTFNLLDGRVIGDLSFGAGADTFLIDNGATYSGILSDSDGALALTVSDGLLDLQGAVGGQVNITTATFGADSELRLRLSETPANSTLIQASGVVTFAPGAVVTPYIPTGLPDGDTIVFLTAGSLFGGANVVNPNLSGDNVPFVYNLAVELTNPMAADGAANGLQAVYDLKDATELGLTINQGIAFDPIIAALRLDDAAAAAFLGLETQGAFDDAYDDLMPSFSSAAAELAATAIQQAQGASGNRLAATRLQGINEVSVWAQEIGYFVSRTPPSLNGQEFTGYGFGMALGIDGPLENGGLFGLSASFITSEVEEEGRPEGEISTTFGQVGAYLGTAIGIVDLDFVAGVGVGQMNSQRYVQIGEDFEAISEAEWWAYEGHGMARASVPLSLGNSFVITPQAALTYVFLAEDGYTEEGGGAAIDYDVDSTTSQRLWGDVGVELSARFRMRGETVIAPRLFAGYRANIIDEEAERTFRFVSTGDEFTLTDEGFGDGGALVGIGVDATNGYSTFSLGYEGEYGDQIERHSINAAIRFRF